MLERSSWYFKSRARDQRGLILRIRDIATNRPRFGYLRIHIMLRREGWIVNKKCVYRLYRLEGLQLQMKVRILFFSGPEENSKSVWIFSKSWGFWLCIQHEMLESTSSHNKPQIPNNFLKPKNFA